MRLLLVEDDAMLGASMKRALERAGYVVDWAVTGDDALGSLLAQDYATAILDLGLPRMGGMDVLKALRSARNETPVLVVTAQDRPDQKVRGLDAGADDFLVKPFDLDEFLARVRARVRRHDRRPGEVLSAGAVSIDLAARQVLNGTEPLALPAREYKALVMLVRHAGRFVSKDDLGGALYDDAAEIDSNTIEAVIYNLRRRLGARTIMTARGLGYMIAR